MTKSTDGYVITRMDGTYDGLGDYLIFATRDEARGACARLDWTDMVVRELDLGLLSQYADETAADIGADYAAAVRAMGDEPNEVARDTGIPRYLVSYWCWAGGPRTPDTSGDGR